MTHSPMTFIQDMMHARRGIWLMIQALHLLLSLAICVKTHKIPDTAIPIIPIDTISTQNAIKSAGIATILLY